MPVRVRIRSVISVTFLFLLFAGAGWSQEGATSTVNAPSLYLRGLDLMKAGEPEEAVQLFRQSLELRPDNGKAHTNLARALLSLDQIEEASAQAAAGIRHASDSGAWNVYGLALLAHEELEKALESFQMAAKLDPDNAWAHNNAGWLLLRAGDYGQAVDALQKAVDLQPHNSLMWHNLAVALEHNQQKVPAQQAFERVLDLQPDHKRAKAGLERVKAARDFH